MKFLVVGWLALAGLLSAGGQSDSLNVNSRYTVETVELSGDVTRISNTLQQEIQAIVGEKFSPAALDDLAARIRKELRAKLVRHRVARGSSPETVRVVFEVTRRSIEFDVSVPKFLYHAKQGWSGAVEGSTVVAHNAFTFGLVSDRDELTERYAGILARYENTKVGTDRMRFRFNFESFHEQWDGNTQRLAGAGGAPNLYRERRNFEPIATFVIAKPLIVSLGTSFQLIQNQYPPARNQAANAIIAAVRFHREMEDSETNRHAVDAVYALRSATGLLESDYGYTRHRAAVRYAFQRGRHAIVDDAQTGFISGRAPLFERFVVGNSSTLRGYNKFEIDPLGGSRLAHNSLEYRYRSFNVFYDVGAVWDKGQDPVTRHSVGIGFRKSGFSMCVALPIREGRTEAILMLGLNY